MKEGNGAWIPGGHNNGGLPLTNKKGGVLEKEQASDRLGGTQWEFAVYLGEDVIERPPHVGEGGRDVICSPLLVPASAEVTGKVGGRESLVTRDVTNLLLTPITVTVLALQTGSWGVTAGVTTGVTRRAMVTLETVKLRPFDPKRHFLCSPALSPAEGCKCPRSVSPLVAPVTGSDNRAASRSCAFDAILP